jgi:IS5 family transposase
MLQKNPKESGQVDMFCSRLKQIIDLRHELARLAELMDWSGIAQDLSKYYCANNGRPGEPIRLMAGLQLLKDLKGISDEEVCASWRENPYFQYFCGEEFFQHRLPVEPASLSIFRKRIGKEGMERLLQETVKLGLKTGAVSAHDLQKVNVDTTVQEKAVTFPTDTKLCHKARLELVKSANKYNIKLRQSYARKSKHGVFMAHKYFAAKQTKRAKKQVKTVRNYLGRVIRDIERAQENNAELKKAFTIEMQKAKTIYAQTLNPKAETKIYSWHAPEVECIAKGKAHKKYEFGCKATIASTNKSNFIIGAIAHHGRPYDGHTLKDVLKHIAQMTGVVPNEAHVDLGYRGHGITDKTTRVIVSRQKRGITPTLKKRQKRRAAVEPVIGHCKNDRAVGPRNWLLGKLGDQINALAMGIGFNLKKILRAIRDLFLFLFYDWLCAEKTRHNTHLVC